MNHDHHAFCLGGGVRRRAFLADVGMGFAGLALGGMLARTGSSGRTKRPWMPPTGEPHSSPRAKSVIWLFMNGGVTHMESFDPKPELTKYGGKTIAETPYADSQSPDKLEAGAGHRHQRRQRPAAEQALSAPGRLSEIRRGGDRAQRLGPAHGELRRRPGDRPLDVHHRRQPRRADAVPLRPPHARRRIPDARGLGPLRPRLAQRQPPAVHQHGQAGVLEREGRPLPGPRPRRRADPGRSQEPARLRQVRRRRCPKRNSGSASISSAG